MASSQTLTPLPATPAPANGHQAHTAPTSSTAAPAGATAPAKAETPTPPAVSGGIGFKLRYDQDTQRLILEARDPVSGFVIYQIPPQYVIKQFSANIGSVEPARGAQVDSAV